MISPHQWERIQAIFEEGLLQTPEQRAELVRRHGFDDETARQLRELWAHAEPPISFLQSPLTFSAAPDAGPVLQPGDRVGERFTILEFLGAGGMGDVYRARDERLDRIVALKVLSARLAGDARHGDALESEARAVSRLNHPRICTLYDAISDGDRLFLVMEYVNGETVESILRRGPLSEERAVCIALEVVEGLHHAHEAGLVHRDVKPGNIMIAANGAKLLDFGIATHSAPSQNTGTQNETRAGTPDYMSPEQAEGRVLDARSDLFSLGVVLREMVTGTRISDGSSSATVSLSADLRDVIDRCLRTNPGDRYATAAELERALQSVQNGARPARLRQALAAVGAITIIAVAALWWSRSGVSDPGSPRLTSLTAYAGVEHSPTLSPDGKQVAFLWSRDDSTDLYVQEIGSDQPRRLTEDSPEERYPQWSPDGRWIAFVRDKNIMAISPSGGPEKTVAEAVSRFEAQCGQTFAWAADSKHLIFNRSPSESPARLSAVSVENGTVRNISQPEAGSVGDWCPVVSLDGSQMFYLHRSSATKRGYRIAGLTPDLIMSGQRDAPWIKGVSFAWAANGRELIHSMYVPTGLFLFRTSADTEMAAKQLPYGEEGIEAAVSRAGDRMVYLRRKLDIDIMSVTLDGPRAGADPSKILYSTRPDTAAQFSPDGRRIAFVSQRGGKAELWVADADGKEPARLTAVRSVSEEVPRWSPDGLRIVALNETGVIMVDSRTGAAETVVPASEAPLTPSISRDGRWVYYSGGRDGARQVWRQPLPAGPPQAIAPSAGYGPLESFDGRELYFVKYTQANADIVAIPSNGGAERHIAATRMGSPLLCGTDRGLYFIARGGRDERSILALYDPSTRNVRTIAELPVKQRFTAHGISVSPDHRRVLYSVHDLQGDLMLVENFR